MYFASAAEFRRWLERHHASKGELLVGFHKVDSGRPSMSWTESVREALCFGWIDGIRKRVDEHRYTIRFSPRKPGSSWSAVNLRHMEELIASGAVTEAGLRVHATRRENTVGIYSYEQRPAELPEPYATTLRRAKKAHAFFHAQPPSYRKVMTWWVISAKREETRTKRLQTLIASSARGERVL